MKRTSSRSATKKKSVSGRSAGACYKAGRHKQLDEAWARIAIPSSLSLKKVISRPDQLVLETVQI